MIALAGGICCRTNSFTVWHSSSFHVFIAKFAAHWTWALPMGLCIQPATSSRRKLDSGIQERCASSWPCGCSQQAPTLLRAAGRGATTHSSVEPHALGAAGCSMVAGADTAAGGSCRQAGCASPCPAMTTFRSGDKRSPGAAVARSGCVASAAASICAGSKPSMVLFSTPAVP